MAVRVCDKSTVRQLCDENSDEVVQRTLFHFAWVLSSAIVALVTLHKNPLACSAARAAEVKLRTQY